MTLHTSDYTDAARRAGLLAYLEPLNRRDRMHALRMAVKNNDGSLIEPSQNGWGPHDCTVTLFGATGIGFTFEDAQRDWMKAASRMADLAETEGA